MGVMYLRGVDRWEFRASLEGSGRVLRSDSVAMERLRSKGVGPAISGDISMSSYPHDMDVEDVGKAVDEVSQFG